MPRKHAEQPTLPGSIYLNGTRWWWDVRLPGEDRRRAIPLKPNGARFATADRRVAESVARQLYRQALHKAEAATDDRPATVADLAAHYNAHMQRKHPHGTQADEARLAMAPLADILGDASPDAVTPAQLVALRETLVEEGLALATINRRVRAILAAFRWAVTRGWLYHGTAYALECVRPLKQGEYGLGDAADVKPVPWETVERTLPHLPPVAADMVLVQWHTGMRSGELVQMRPMDIDRRTDVWLYRPQRHKTQRWGHQRIIGIGQRAQDVLRPYLLRPDDQPMFVPSESERRRLQRRHADRRTPAGQGNEPGTHRVADPRRQPGDRYTSTVYGQAVARAVRKANAAARKKARAEGRKVRPDELIEDWHPHQVRHAFATRSREVMDLDAVRAQMGHRTLGMTDHYARLAMEKLARETAKRMG